MITLPTTHGWMDVARGKSRGSYPLFASHSSLYIYIEIWRTTTGQGGYQLVYFKFTLL